VQVAFGSKIGEKVFPFDRVYDTSASQREIYNETVEPMVQQTLRGFNTTVFAYGQTGTGKTFTMEGDVDDPEKMGVIPRAMASIFRTLEARGEAHESFVKASFLEIYNENCTDLLAVDEPGADGERAVLRVVEDKTRVGRGVIVHGLQEVLVKSSADIQRVMKQAISRRKTAATDLNEQSSRSHAIFTVTVHIRETNEAGEEMLKVGKINLVDLAGSESAARSGSKDVRAREAGNINQSLLTLGRVITALVEKSPHVPYRDSKLTRLLQESLGGCALTCILATVAPSVQCLEETLSTLEYAARAKSIRNRPVANQKMSKKLMFKELMEENERLRSELQTQRAKDGVFLSEAQYGDMQQRLKGTTSQVGVMEQLLEKHAAELAEAKGTLQATYAELDHTAAAWRATQAQLASTHDQLVAERRVSEERQVVIEAHVNTESRLLDVHDALQSTLNVAAERVETLQDRVDADARVCGHNAQVVGAHKGVLGEQLRRLDGLTVEAHRVADEAFAAMDEKLERLEKLVAGEWQAERTALRERIVSVGRGHVDRVVARANDDAERDAAAVDEEAEWAQGAMDFARAGVDELAGKTAALAGEWERAKRAETDALRRRALAPVLEDMARCRKALGDTRARTQLSLDSIAAHARLVAQQSAQDAQQTAALADAVGEQVRHEVETAAATAVERITAIVAALAHTSLSKADAARAQTLQRVAAAHEVRAVQLEGVASSADALASELSAWAEGENKASERACAVAAAEDAYARELGSESEARELLAESLASAQRQVDAVDAAKARTGASLARAQDALQQRQEALGEAQRAAHADLQGASFSARDNDSRVDAHAVEALQDNRRRALKAAVFGRDRAAETAAALGEAGRQVRGLALREIEHGGRTPLRSQALSWPTERPTTGPHDELLARYRRAREGEDVSVPSAGVVGGDENVRPAVNVPPPPAAAVAKEANLQELRQALRDKGLSIVGTKAQLIQRLEAA